jgi:hypothetical protein
MRKSSLLAAFLCCIAAASDSIATEIKCPDSISETPVVEARGDGWEVVAEPGHRPLDKVGVFLFHPAQHGALVPDSTKRTKTEERLTWQLVRGQTDEFWVGCMYQGTTAILAQRLAKDVGQCVASYRLLPSGTRLRLIAMSCTRL